MNKKCNYIIQAFITIIIASAVPAHLFPQDAARDFLKINNAYSQAKNLSLKVNYTAFKDHITQEKTETKQGVIKKGHANLLYNKIDNLEHIRNKNYYMIINHDDKLILISKIIENTYQKEQILSVDIKKILSYCESVEYKKINDALSSYTLKYNSSQYEKVTIVFNTKTYFIEKMVLFYHPQIDIWEKRDTERKKETPRLEITYSDIQSNVAIPEYTFTYNKYLFKKDGKFQTKSKYINYNLIDQLSKM